MPRHISIDRVNYILSRNKIRQSQFRLACAISHLNYLGIFVIPGSDPFPDAGSIAKAITDDNGIMSTEEAAQSELKRRMSQDGPDAKRSKTVEVQSLFGESAQVKSTNGTVVSDVPEPKVTGSVAVVEDETKMDAEDWKVTAGAETTPAASEPISVLNKDCVADTHEELTVQPEPPIPTKARSSSLTVADTDEEPAQVIAVTDTESQDDSVVDLDTTIDSDANEPRLPQPETTRPTEPVKDAMETPDVSITICPLEKQQPLILANNRISELLLSNGSSTPNTSQPTTAEFQATPIKKPEASITEEEEAFTSSVSVSDDSKKSISSDGKPVLLYQT